MPGSSENRPITLFGADGQPLLPVSRDANPAALDYLTRAGVTRTQSGDLVVPAAALEQIRAQRMRNMTMTAVPHTPKWMFRDAGGAAVQKGHGRYETLSLRGIRKIRERSPMLQAIHSARHYQVRRLSAQKWSGKPTDVGWRIVHKDFAEHNSNPPDSIKPFIARFEGMFEHPSARYCPTTQELLGQLEEDLLTINRPAVEVLYSLADPKRIVGFAPVDGGILWPTLLFVEQWVLENQATMAKFPTPHSYEETLDIVANSIGWELYGAEWALVREGQCEGVYPAHKIIISPIKNRTDVEYAGYPPSHVEQAIEIVLAHINAWDYNASYMTRGMMAEMILGISGDFNDEDIQAFVDQFREGTQGVRNAWGVPILPLNDPQSTITKIDLKPAQKDMMMELWFSVLGSLAAAVYRLHMSSVNMKPWDGGGAAKLSEGSQEVEIALAKEEGLQGDVSHLTQHTFNVLAQRCHPDLRVYWEYGNFDPTKQAQLNEIRSRVDTTRNELRLEQGKSPKGFWLSDEDYETASPEDQLKYDDNPWNWPTDPGFAAAHQQAKMMEQMQTQQSPFGEDPAGFGGAAGSGAAPFGALGGGGKPPGAGGPPGAPPKAGPPGPPGPAAMPGMPRPGGAPPAGGGGRGTPGAAPPLPMSKGKTVHVYVEED